MAEPRVFCEFRLSEFLERCNFGLKRLAISCDTVILLDELLGALILLPHLQCLALHNITALQDWHRFVGELESELLVRRSPAGGSWEQPLWPNLERIVFEHCSDFQKRSVLDSLVKFFTRRWEREGPSLCSFEVIDCQTPDFDLHPTIKGIRCSARYCSL